LRKYKVSKYHVCFWSAFILSKKQTGSVNNLKKHSYRKTGRLKRAVY
jgi:hypothetical protein